MLLRLDKAIYKGGDTLKVDIRTSAGLPTVYLDIVRGGQIAADASGSTSRTARRRTSSTCRRASSARLEVHAYQMLASGEIIRDSRVVYVQPGDDLKIDVKADKDVYLPGEEGTIRFEVTDSAGQADARPRWACIIVDEAVYALQEMQPGLEKVYFTLQEELLKPQAQAVYKPGDDEDIGAWCGSRPSPALQRRIAQAGRAAGPVRRTRPHRGRRPRRPTPPTGRRAARSTREAREPSRCRRRATASARTSRPGWPAAVSSRPPRSARPARSRAVRPAR